MCPNIYFLASKMIDRNEKSFSHVSVEQTRYREQVARGAEIRGPKVKIGSEELIIRREARRTTA